MAKSNSMRDLLKQRMSAAQQVSEMEIGNRAYESLIDPLPVAASTIRELPVDKLRPFFTTDIGFHPYPPDKLRAFSQQLLEQGLLERIIVRSIPDSDEYEILAGHNRTAAWRMVGHDTIPAEVVVANDARAIIIATATNLLRRQELTIIERGKAYKATQIDAIVTSLIQQYEEEGIEIDGVEINSDFDEDDLCRFIAISSVAYQQDLEVMTTEAVLSLATSRLRYEPTLNIFESGGLLKRTLVIKIDHLDPEAFMDQISFEEDARTWAGALYEVLTESNALEEYAEYYAPYRPNYSGDTGYTGDYEHGGSYGNTIDTSGFVSPSTKNNVDLAAYAMQAWENNWGYCWGTYGNVLTEALFNYKLQQYPEGVGKYEDFIRANWLGRRTADCIGLIKGYGWLDTASGSINYGTNGMPDVGADQMYANAQKSGMAGTMDTMPELVGIALWKQGHIGVYIGNGYAVEAMGTKYGVVRTEVAGRGWQGWCRIPYIEYREAG